METAIVILILVAIVAGIGLYLYRAKKRGETCIGCPYAKQCGGKCNGSCHGDEEQSSDHPQDS